MRVEHLGLPGELAPGRRRARPACARQAAAHLVDERAAGARARREELLVGDLGQALPAVGARAVAVAQARAVERGELGPDPGLGVHAVRDVADRDVVDLDARDRAARTSPARRSPCRRLTPFTRAAMRMPSAAMLKTPGSPPASAPSASRRSSGRPGRHAALAEVARHEVAREAVDAGRHRRVRREDRARAHDLQRVLGIAARVLDQAPHALDAEEAGVALVHVEHRGLDAARGERLDAADAEQDLLAQAVLAVAAVEAVGDGALGRRVLGHVRVEQQQRHAADVDAPEHGVQRRRPGAARDPDARAVRREHGRERQERRVEVDELLLLRAGRPSAAGGSSRCGRRARCRRSARRGRWRP